MVVLILNFVFQSQFGSRASKRSQKGDSYVDETLFGGKKAGSKGVGANAAVITLDELRTIRSKTEKNNQNDAVVISKADLDRIKGATVIKTTE